MSGLARCLLTATFACLVAAGCGSSDQAEAPPTPDDEQSLKELGEVYHYLQAQKLPVPRKVDDLVEYEGSLQGALPKIRAGDLVVVWGTGYSSGSSQVLAYAKDAAASGGKVLLRNGAVKQLSADEFKAAKR